LKKNKEKQRKTKKNKERKTKKENKENNCFLFQILHEHLFPDASRKARTARKRIPVTQPPAKPLYDHR
jgi:hypothetical protein